MKWFLLFLLLLVIVLGGIWISFNHDIQKDIQANTHPDSTKSDILRGTDTNGIQVIVVRNSANGQDAIYGYRFCGCGQLSLQDSVLSIDGIRLGIYRNTPRLASYPLPITASDVPHPSKWEEDIYATTPKMVATVTGTMQLIYGVPVITEMVVFPQKE